MNAGKVYAIMCLSFIGLFVIGSYFQYPYLRLMGVVATGALVLGIIYNSVVHFISWFEEALQDWKEGL